MTLRKAKLEDLKEIQSLFVDTIRSACKNDYDEAQIEAWVSSIENRKRWEELIIEQYIIVAHINHIIVGFASADFEKGNYLDFMYVHKDYLRRGIANTLYLNLEKEFLKKGFDSIESNVSITARPFFEKKGFVVQKQNVNKRNGVEIINYHMIRN